MTKATATQTQTPKHRIPASLLQKKVRGSIRVGPARTETILTTSGQSWTSPTSPSLSGSRATLVVDTGLGPKNGATAARVAANYLGQITTTARILGEQKINMYTLGEEQQGLGEVVKQTCRDRLLMSLPFDSQGEELAPCNLTFPEQGWASEAVR